MQNDTVLDNDIIRPGLGLGKRLKSKEKLHVGVKWELGLGTVVLAWYKGRDRTAGWDSLQVQNCRGPGTGANLEADIFDLWTGTTTRSSLAYLVLHPAPGLVTGDWQINQLS